MLRRGVTILEVCIAILLMGAVLAGVGQLLAVVTAQQREGQRRLAALHEAANQMERLAVTPWSKLNPETAAEATLSEEATAALPGAKLIVRVIEVESGESDAPPPARRMEVELSWRNTAGRQTDPVRLTAWRYAEEAPP